jgi:hypothetical protein
MANLNKILADAPKSFGEEFIVLRGQLLQSGNADTFLLNHDPSTSSVQAEISSCDVLGALVAVRGSDLAAWEIGHKIHEVRVRFGAQITMRKTHWVTIGEGRVPEPNFDDRCCGAAGSDGEVSLAKALKDAPGALGERSIILRGLLLPGGDKASVLLQPDPSSRRDWAEISKDDILERSKIEQVPESALAAHEKGFALSYIRVRYGATITLVRTAIATVGVTPLHNGVEQPAESVKSGCACGPGNGGQIVEEEPNDGEEPPPLASTGTCKVTNGSKTCDGKKTKGMVCASPGTTCSYGAFSGICTTECHWFWGVACDCDL